MTTSNQFNQAAIAELPHMANLRNHLMILSQNGNLSTSGDSRLLRGLCMKIDKEIMRRALANDVEKAPPKVKKKVVKKAASKKATAKAIKRVDAN